MMKNRLRHRLLPLCAMLLSMALLAACGASTPAAEGGTASPSGTAANSSDSVQSAQSGTDTAAEASTAEQTRTYTDAAGREIQLPARPQHIVAHFFAPEMVALGAPVVGTNYANAKLSLTEEQMTGMADISGEGVNPNVEAVLALEPDLILVPNFLETATVDALEKIAPTVVMDYSEESFARLRKLGEIVGMKDQADQWIANYEEKAKQKREELKSYVKEGETASAFIMHSDQKLYVYGPQRLGPTMYDALGFIQPDKLAELTSSAPDALWTEISLEVLPEYAGDRIFFVTPSSNEEALNKMKELQNSAVWKEVPAVKNGHVYVVESRWALNDPLTLDWLLDEMPKQFMQ